MGLNRLCRDEDKEAFDVIYEIESYLRILIKWKLTSSKGVQWKGVIGDFKKAADDRIAQERELGYLDATAHGLLSYLNLSELKDIFLQVLWSEIKGGAWPSQELLAAEFKKLIGIRNKLAHFRPTTGRDRRVASRFAEDLCDWTKEYKRARTYAPKIDVLTDDLTVFETRMEKLVPGFGAFLGSLKARASGDAALVLSTVDGQLSITRDLANIGRLCESETDEFLSAHGKEVSFIRVMLDGTCACIYLPLSLGLQRIIQVTEAFLSIETVDTQLPGNGGEFYGSASELYVPWTLELPPSYSYALPRAKPVEMPEI